MKMHYKCVDKLICLVGAVAMPLVVHLPSVGIVTHRQLKQAAN